VTEKPERYSAHAVEDIILTVRGQKVILDADLAQLYGVETRVLNQAVRRNCAKFPSDFMFRLTREEAREAQGLRSQNVILKRGRHRKYLPYAFTEHGAIMAANVLNSPRAVQMSVFVVRAFIKMRELLLNRAELEKRLAEIEKTLLSHDDALRELYQKIRPLLLPPPRPPRKPIGFGVREKRAGYRVKKSRRKG
jgi:phage regulator Rha-like protein